MELSAYHSFLAFFSTNIPVKHKKARTFLCPSFLNPNKQTLQNGSSKTSRLFFRIFSCHFLAKDMRVHVLTLNYSFTLLMM